MNRLCGWVFGMENAIVPIFECPTCGKQELVPLAVCEWMLETSALKVVVEQNHREDLSLVK
jgi:hypothetical protein